MNIDLQIGRTTRAVGLIIVMGVLFSAMLGWALWRIPLQGYPTWLPLVAPPIGLGVMLVGLLKYDWLVLVTFCTFGFVRYEPAPFDILLMMLLALGLMTGRLRWRPSKRSALQVGLWGLIVANLLSAVPVIPLSQCLRFLGITLYVLVIFCFVRMYAVEQRAVRFLLVGYTVGAVFNVLLVLFGLIGLSQPDMVLRFATRAVGFFKDPNVYGPFLVMPMLWLIDQIVQRPLSPARTGSLLFLVGLLGTGTMLSLSRAAWINLAFSLGLYFPFLLSRGSREQTTRFLVLAIALVVATVLIFQGFGLIDDALARLGFKGYDKTRFGVQRGGVVAGLTHPIGVGPGQWPNTHSLYARTLAEHGLLGFISLGLLIGGLTVPLVRRIWQHSHAVDKEILSDRVLLASIGGQLVNSLVIDSIHWRHLWMLFGLAWAALDTQRVEE